jgi:hypothetical protein
MAPVGMCDQESVVYFSFLGRLVIRVFCRQIHPLGLYEVEMCAKSIWWKRRTSEHDHGIVALLSQITAIHTTFTKAESRQHSD